MGELELIYEMLKDDIRRTARVYGMTLKEQQVEETAHKALSNFTTLKYKLIHRVHEEDSK